MTQTIAQALAFVILTAFLAILVIWVPRWDLGLVLGATVALVAIDFFVKRR
jgi:hypothetical protein